MTKEELAEIKSWVAENMILEKGEKRNLSSILTKAIEALIQSF